MDFKQSLKTKTLRYKCAFKPWVNESHFPHWYQWEYQELFPKVHKKINWSALPMGKESINFIWRTSDFTVTKSYSHVSDFLISNNYLYNEYEDTFYYLLRFYFIFSGFSFSSDMTTYQQKNPALRSLKISEERTGLCLHFYRPRTCYTCY